MIDLPVLATPRMKLQDLDAIRQKLPAELSEDLLPDGFRKLRLIHLPAAHEDKQHKDG